ncbi:MAG: AAA family ATPase, partial [Actinomycetia bacterium]|nr:AAA family ATPase [Actinomycetes bacterium]
MGIAPDVLGRTSFVGRDRELTRVVDALARPSALVLIEGEAGIGKSRLVREALAVADGEGTRTLVAVCPPFLEAFTLGPLVDALRQAAPGVGGLGLSAVAGALRPLFPEWADGLPPAPEPPADAGAARHRLIRALAELLDRLGVEVLVVEDVHWADAATLDFLVYVASRRPRPLTLVLTSRPEEVAADSPLLRLTSRPVEGVCQVRAVLGGLPVREAAGLVSSMLGGEPVSAGFAAFLHGRTEGVPLALEECVRLLRDRGDLARRNGEWGRRRRDEIAVPPTIRDSVTERVARLGADARRVLLAAAVLTDPVDERTLATVAG